MEIILRRSETDEEMLEVLTKNPRGKENLWAVVHSDFLFQEDGGKLYEIMKLDDEITLKVRL